MPEHARDCTVILLDGTQLKVPIKSSLLVDALLDIASSHAGLKKDENRNFFGLYVRNNGWNNWLDTDKPVLSSHHDIPKPPYVLFLHYGVRYYVEDYRQIQSAQALEMYYLQVKRSVLEEELVCTPDNVYNLAACVMQTMFGDYSEESEAESNYQKLDCLPQALVSEPGKDQCRGRILTIYKNMRGLSRAESIIRYLDIAQALQAYGHHQFRVRDKRENVFFVGIGRDGVKIFSAANRMEHAEKFQWRALMNVTYKDKKFWFDVSDGSKGGGAGHAHTYYAATTREAMNIWQMAKDQHSFFKKRKNIGPYHSATVNEQIMDQLNSLGSGRGSGGGVTGNGRLSPSGSTNSLSSVASAQSQLSHASCASSQTNKTTVSVEAHEAARKAQNDIYTAFMSKRGALMLDLEQNIKSYKELQAKEMRITGVRPEGLSDDDLKELSQRVQGNQYRFSKLLLEDAQDETSSLERELELKRAIIDANKRLVSETQNKKLRRDRKKDLKEQEDKFRELQMRVERRKESSGLYFKSKTSEFHIPTPSEGSYSLQSGTLPRLKKKKNSLPSSADDSCIAEMLFDSQSSSSGLNGRLSPRRASTLSMLTSRQMNKSTGALNDIISTHSTGGGGGGGGGGRASTMSSSNIVIQRSPVPQHRGLLGSNPQAYKSKARSLLSLSDQQDNSSNEPTSPANSSSYSFQFSEAGDSFQTGTGTPPMSISSGGGGYRLQQNNSLRAVNLTDEFLNHFVGPGDNDFVPSSAPTSVSSFLSDRSDIQYTGGRGEVANFSGSKFSPNLSTRYSINPAHNGSQSSAKGSGGPISRSSVMHYDGVIPPTNQPRHGSSPGIFFEEFSMQDQRSRTTSYSIATRENPVTSGHNTPTVPHHPYAPSPSSSHAHIRPANCARDSDDTSYQRLGYGQAQSRSSRSPGPASPLSGGGVGRSSSMMNKRPVAGTMSSASSTSSTSATDLHLHAHHHKPYQQHQQQQQHQQRGGSVNSGHWGGGGGGRSGVAGGYLESHPESSLEMPDPLASLRGNGQSASEGTYV